MKLLIETTYSDSESLIAESLDSNGEKAYWISGIFMQAEVVNGNRRIYPKEVLYKATDQLQKQIKANKLFGELNHPETNSNMLNPDRACVKITELTYEGNNIMGKAKVMKDVPCGAIVHGLLKEGIVIGVSSRGFGEVKRNEQGIAVVQAPLILKTIDVVSEPSAPEAYMTAVMENKEWVYANGVLVEKDVKDIINQGTRKNKSNKQIFEQIIAHVIKK